MAIFLIKIVSVTSENEGFDYMNLQQKYTISLSKNKLHDFE